MTLQVNEDALFRAVTACGYKLLAYHLNLDSGEISSRTLRPEELAAAPEGPSVKPLPKLGGDLTGQKHAQPFGPPPVELKKKLFNDEASPRRSPFDSEFFKRDDKQTKNIFGDGGFKRESGTKKLAQMFGESAPKAAPQPFKPAAAPSAVPRPAQAQSLTPPPTEDPRRPRIPVAGEAQQQQWMRAFARDCGDPEIRDALNQALDSAKPLAAFERALRKFARMGQQWERYYRKTALDYGEAWLSTLGVQWTLVETK